MVKQHQEIEVHYIQTVLEHRMVGTAHLQHCSNYQNFKLGTAAKIKKQ